MCTSQTYLLYLGVPISPASVGAAAGAAKAHGNMSNGVFQVGALQCVAGSGSERRECCVRGAD